MPIAVAELYFNDSATKHNRDLTTYLKRNITEAIRRGNLKFRFKIAKANELATLRNAGINRLPAMILNKRHYIGVPNIVDELARCVKNSRMMAPVKSDDEILHDYLHKEIGDPKKTSDGRIDPNSLEQESNETFDPQSAFHREAERRRRNEEGDHSQKYMRPAPPKPAHDTMQDNDYEDRAPRNQPAQRPAYAPRQDYTPRQDNVDPGDARMAFDRIKYQPGGDPKDNDMFTAMLEKMGSADL